MKRETGQRKISSFLVGEAFDERLMKNYPTDFQTLTYTYHQIISLSRIISPYGKMRQTSQEKRMSRQGKKTDNGRTFQWYMPTGMETQQGMSSARRKRHTVRQCTTGLMLAQERIFPRIGKYRSLLGDFSSRTNKLVLKIPNRPRCCTPLDTLPESSARAEHRQKQETNETKCQTNKS